MKVSPAEWKLLKKYARWPTWCGVGETDAGLVSCVPAATSVPRRQGTPCGIPLVAAMVWRWWWSRVLRLASAFWPYFGLGGIALVVAVAVCPESVKACLALSVLQAPFQCGCSQNRQARSECRRAARVEGALRAGVHPLNASRPFEAGALRASVGRGTLAIIAAAVL